MFLEYNNDFVLELCYDVNRRLMYDKLPNKKKNTS